MSELTEIVEGASSTEEIEGWSESRILRAARESESVDLLGELYRAKPRSWRVRAALAQNPAAPPDLLRQLWADVLQKLPAREKTQLLQLRLVRAARAPRELVLEICGLEGPIRLPAFGRDQTRIISAAIWDAKQITTEDREQLLSRYESAWVSSHPDPFRGAPFCGGEPSLLHTESAWRALIRDAREFYSGELDPVKDAHLGVCLNRIPAARSQAAHLSIITHPAKLTALLRSIGRIPGAGRW